MTHGALTRVAVAAAATRVAANFSVGPGHERLLSTVGTRDERPKRFKFWSEAFLRYPPDGAPPYVHPLWLLALGRDVDPEGPPHRFPPGSGVPDKPDFLPSAH